MKDNMLGKKYKNLVQIGQGQFGVVYRALDNSDRFVAIKKYAKLTGKEISYIIIREVNMMRIIHHPNIIRLYDIHMSPSDVAVVMEYGGDNLGNYLGHLTLREKIAQVKHVMYQIILGCSYLHRLNIIHRDLKPDNILVTWDDAKPLIKICDLGLAKKTMTSGEINSHQICTLSYRPPELFTTDSGMCSKSVDIWSIGCIMYEFMTGKKLFPGRTELKVLQSILQQIPTTEKDLAILNLDNIKPESCNTDKYYKFPTLYDLSTRSEERKSFLDTLCSIAQSMLVLNPEKRKPLEDILADPFFDDTRNNYYDFESSIKNYQIRRSQNFKPRQQIRISSELREICVRSIFGLRKEFHIHQQTPFLAINVFDQFLAGCQYNQESIKGIILHVASCCVVLASKYIDIKPLSLRNFVHEKFPLKKLIALEREILEEIGFDLCQPTLIDFYYAAAGTSIRIPDKHIACLEEIILDYRGLIGKGMLELEEILANKIKKVII